MNAAQQYTVGQRVTLDLPNSLGRGKQRLGTVKEVQAGSGAVRVEIDLVTMHEWVRPEALTPVAPTADAPIGVEVAWVHEGVPHYSPRRTLTGVVLDVRTRLDDVGVRTSFAKVQLYVKSRELNLPKWVDLDAVQFVAKPTAEAIGETKFRTASAVA